MGILMSVSAINAHAAATGAKMEATSETPSFTINLDVEENFKPLPYVIKKPKKGRSSNVSLPEKYPSHSESFFDAVNSCSQMIGTLKSDQHKKYNDDLTRIFARRDYSAIMRLYYELFRLQLGETSDTSSKPHRS